MDFCIKNTPDGFTGGASLSDKNSHAITAGNSSKRKVINVSDQWIEQLFKEQN